MRHNFSDSLTDATLTAAARGERCPTLDINTGQDMRRSRVAEASVTAATGVKTEPEEWDDAPRVDSLQPSGDDVGPWKPAIKSEPEIHLWDLPDSDAVLLPDVKPAVSLDQRARRHSVTQPSDSGVDRWETAAESCQAEESSDADLLPGCKVEEEEEVFLPVSRFEEEVVANSVDPLLLPGCKVEREEVLMPVCKIERELVRPTEVDPLLIPCSNQEEENEEEETVLLQDTTFQEASDTSASNSTTTHVVNPELVEDTRVKLFPCKMCTKTYVSKDVLCRHMSTHDCVVSLQRIVIDDSATRYVCDTCGEHFAPRGFLTKHVLLHSGASSAVRDVTSKLSSKKVLIEPDSVRNKTVAIDESHVLSDTLCADKRKRQSPNSGVSVNRKRGIAFDTKMKHKKHVLSNDGKCKKSFMCDVLPCAKRYATLAHLNKQTAVHSDKTPFVCNVDTCFKRFQTKQEFKRHKVVHTDIRPYVCSVRKCDMRFKLKQEIRRHKAVHSDTKRVSCDVCDFRCRGMNSMRRHMAIHFKPDPWFQADRFVLQGGQCLKKFIFKSSDESSKIFACEEPACGKRFKIKKDLNSHKSVHSDVRPFACVRCDYRGKSQYRLRCHMNTHYQQDPASVSSNLFAFECGDCGKKFIDKRLLRRHVLTHAGDSSRVFACDEPTCMKRYKTKQELHRHKTVHSGDEPFVCDFAACGKRFKVKSNLRMHKAIHSDVKPFSCGNATCNKSFKSKSYLKVHQALHEEVKPFVCGRAECGRRFYTKRGREMHKAVHSDVKPFSCDLPKCVKRFKFVGDLNAHKKVHSDIKPFSCNIGTCTKRYKCKRALTVHKGVHSDYKPFVCSVAKCAKAFRLNSELTSHEAVHLTVRPYGCEKCDYRCKRRYELKTHMKKVHSEGNKQAK